MKKTLVIGGSTNPERYAYKAILSLVNKEYKVVAIGQRDGEVEGVKIQTQMIPLKGIHTVTLYVNPSAQKNYYNYIIGLTPKRVIFNPGTENPEFYDLLRQNNIQVDVACTLVLLATNQY